jgi:predicted acylesterase/phospholipase RssA
MDKEQQDPRSISSRPYRILSLNGGGVRGIFQAEYLSRLASELNTRISDCFDLIAGTSTGAIIGLALGLGVDPKRLVDFYKNHAKRIFHASRFSSFRRGARYNQTLLRAYLTEIFGTRQLKDAATTMLITATSLDQFAYRIFESFPGQVTADGPLSAVDVALASSAAPTYFDPVKPVDQQRSYVDGGLWANSPSSVAIIFAHRKLDIPLDSIRLLSVGTGDFPSGATPEFLKERRPISPSAIQLLFELMFSSQASYADTYAQQLLGYQNVLRISPQLDEVIALDDVDKSILKLLPLAEAEFENSIGRVKDLLLSGVVKVGKNEVPKGPTLAPRDLIEAAGLSAIYPSRKFYSKHRAHAGSIDTYISTARKTAIMVSVNLMTGLPFDDLIGVLERKLEDRSNDFTAVISLLNPGRPHLIASIAPVFGMEVDELRNGIRQTLRRLIDFREGLSAASKQRFSIRVHNAIPFGSAILLDHHESDGRIQIETKPYKAPLRDSFAFEIVPTEVDGLYKALTQGYEALLRDGDLIDLEALARL